jgi:hypothetical protein
LLILDNIEILEDFSRDVGGKAEIRRLVKVLERVEDEEEEEAKR